MHRKDAITNVQLKQNSSHDPKILVGTFKGFVHRAFKICSKQYIEEELKFITEVFVENGYLETDLNKIIDQIRSNINNSLDSSSNTENEESTTKIVSLPWIPGISPKLKKAYKKAGVKVVFKSPANLQTLLTAKQKSALPSNSYPGIYSISCSCSNKPYIGETKLRVSTRIHQHQDNANQENWEYSGITSHAQTCSGNIHWDTARTLKIDNNKFTRKVREALEGVRIPYPVRFFKRIPDPGRFFKQIPYPGRFFEEIPDSRHILSPYQKATYI